MIKKQLHIPTGKILRISSRPPHSNVATSLGTSKSDSVCTDEIEFQGGTDHTTKEQPQESKQEETEYDHVADLSLSSCHDSQNHNSLQCGIAINLLEKKFDDFEVKFAERFRKISDLEKNMHGSRPVHSMPVAETATPIPPSFDYSGYRFLPSLPNEITENCSSINAIQENNQQEYKTNHQTASFTTTTGPGAILPNGQVKIKYPKLVNEAIGALAVKLAKESIFGNDLMKTCTVKGHRDLPALPAEGLSRLKDTLYGLFPKFWENPALFEPLWNTASKL